MGAKKSQKGLLESSRKAHTVRREDEAISESPKYSEFFTSFTLEVTTTAIWPLSDCYLVYIGGATASN